MCGCDLSVKHNKVRSKNTFNIDCAILKTSPILRLAASDLQQLNVVFCAIVMSRILYALPAWGGFLSNELIAKIDAFFKKKAVSWGYSCELKSLSGLLHEADAQLFRKMVNNKEHCIHQLLPPGKILPMKFRASNRIFALPLCHFNVYERSFVLRSLFEDAY